VRTGVPAGIVNEVAPRLVFFAPSAGTARDPSRISVPPIFASVDRKNRVVLGGAGSPPPFWIVSLTLNAVPA
jgi:hypothetical protein